MHAKIISKTNCILIPMIVTSSTDGQSQPFSKQSPTVRRPQRYAKLFPFLQSRVNIPMSKQHCNSSSYRYYIPSDANQTRKQTTMHVGCKLCKQAALLYHSLEFIHAHPSTHTHAHSHTATWSAAKASNWPDSDCFLSRCFDKQATNDYPLYMIRQWKLETHS